VVEPLHGRSESTQTVKAHSAFAFVDGLAQREALHEIKLFYVVVYVGV
jgi:hypothetical protein